MRNYSIAIFGSVLRDDFDKYSDKDLLVVAKDFKTLNELKLYYSSKGWAPSFYTYSKLEYLSANGSLFIKHLKKESQIIIDDNQKLSKIISNFKQKKSYRADLKDSKKFFEILKYIPKTSLGYAWFCDSLFVGLRNYLVFENAQNGIFEFSFMKLLKILENRGVIDQKDIKILKELRVIKSNYRESLMDEMPTYSFCKKVQSIFEKLEIFNKTEFVEKEFFQSWVENNILEKKFNPYQRLRLVEGLYTAREIDNPEIKKIISNPQFYSCKMKDDAYTSKLVSAIKTTHNIGSQQISGLIQKV